MRAPQYNLDNIEALKVTKAYFLMNKSEREQFKALILDLYQVQETSKNKEHIEQKEHVEKKDNKQMMNTRRSMYSRRTLMQHDI